MVTGDFTGDGKLDLAVEYTGGGTIAVLLGNGDGTFQAPKFYAVGTAYTPFVPGIPWWRVTSPVTAGSIWPSPTSGSNDVSVLLGNGDGTFQTPGDVRDGIESGAVVAGDFTGDGQLDSVAAVGSRLVLGQWRRHVPARKGLPAGSDRDSWLVISTATAGSTSPAAAAPCL